MRLRPRSEPRRWRSSAGPSRPGSGIRPPVPDRYSCSHGGIHPDHPPGRQPEAGAGRHPRSPTSSRSPSAPGSPRPRSSPSCNGKEVDLSPHARPRREAGDLHHEEPRGAGAHPPRRRARGRRRGAAAVPRHPGHHRPAIEDGFYYDFFRDKPFTPGGPREDRGGGERGDRAGPAVRPHGGLDGRGDRALRGQGREVQGRDHQGHRRQGREDADALQPRRLGRLLPRAARPVDRARSA